MENQNIFRENMKRFGVKNLNENDGESIESEVDEMMDILQNIMDHIPSDKYSEASNSYRNVFVGIQELANMAMQSHGSDHGSAPGSDHGSAPGSDHSAHYGAANKSFSTKKNI